MQESSANYSLFGVFACNNSEVILSTFTCDGKEDCSDGSDEYCGRNFK